jgi:putative ATP-dependent endonuclease of the OLD family
MRLRRLQIEWFRGIRSLDWRVAGPTTCLVGPNDSGKTTILDAVELVLWPRWSAPLDDTDFYNADTSKPIKISATVGSLPAQVIREDRFGMHLQGWPPFWETDISPEHPAEPEDVFGQ